MPSAIATMPSPCSRTSRISSVLGRLAVAGVRAAARRCQWRAERMASGGEAYAWTLNQPFSPQASPMRPTSRASAGHPASAMRATTRPGAASGRRGLRLLDQAADGGRHLGAVAGPVLDPVEGDAKRLLGARGNGVVEANALDEAAVATHARI